MVIRHHHNTTGEQGSLLQFCEDKAKTQDDLILKFYQDRPKGIYAPHTVHETIHGQYSATPLTSTRRAISNLTRRRLLFKTNIKMNGPMGRPTTGWRLAKHGDYF